MEFLRLFLVGIFTLAIAGCGGGGSDGGGGGGGTTVYTASGPFKVNGSSTNIVVTITVSGNIVTVTDGKDSGTAPLSSDGKNFSVPVTIAPNPSFHCNKPFVVTGVISGTSISGKYSGVLTCTINGATGTAVISGSFSGTQTSGSKISTGSGFSRAVSNSI